MNSIDSDSNAIVTVNTIDVCTQGLEDTELKANNMMVVGTDNNYEAQIEDLDDLDITVAKKEYVITGDDIYIPQLYDDAPQWMKDLVGLVVDVSMTTNNTQLVNVLNKMLQEFAVSYVPLNQYTQSILDLGNEDMRLNALIETLNSNFNNGLSDANAQIINLQMTKASKDEVLAQIIQTLAAELANPDSNLGATVVRLEQAIVTEQTARATSFEALTASMESIDGEIAAKAEVLENALAYVGIDEAGASTNTGLSAYLEASDGTIGGADSQLANSIRVTAEGVESKWAYNSIVNINGVYKKSGFGLTTNYTNSGTADGTQANPYTSEFWIDATKLRFTNSNATGRKAPFTIDASGTTPEITFNGNVSFTNVTGLSTNITNSILLNNEDLAKQLGYLNYSNLVNAYSAGTTIINGGYINTGLIKANGIVANQINTVGLIAENISADEIVGKTITGATINGARINGAVIRASYLDLDGDLELLTNYIITVAMYNANPSLYTDAVYIESDNQYRIPSISTVREVSKTQTLSSTGATLKSKIRSYNCANAGHNMKCVRIKPYVYISGVSADISLPFNKNTFGNDMSTALRQSSTLQLFLGSDFLGIFYFKNSYSATAADNGPSEEKSSIMVYFNNSLIYEHSAKAFDGNWYQGPPSLNTVKNIGGIMVRIATIGWNNVRVSIVDGGYDLISSFTDTSKSLIEMKNSDYRAYVNNTRTTSSVITATVNSATHINNMI